MPTSFDMRNEVFDQLVSSRRSIRVFTDEIPPRAQIDSILTAGLMAPFAQAAVGDAADFRRFIVFPKDGNTLKMVVDLLREKGKAQLDALRDRAPDGAPFLKKLTALAEGRIPGLGTAPYLIAVAELKGLPSVEQQSIAHCLENMWLKATALDLGFHLVSAMALLADEPRFWELCRLEPGRYDMNGCAIGIPAGSPTPKQRPPIEEAVIWMD